MSDPVTPSGNLTPLSIPANTNQLRAPRSTDLLSPSSPHSPGPLAASSHKRQSSLADILATPPPLQQQQQQHHANDFNLKRRTSNASNLSSDDGSGAAAINYSSIPSVSFSTSYPNDSGLPKDWQDVQMNQLVQRDNLVFVEGDTSVENAFEILESHQFTSLPVRVNPTDVSISDTFDYADLNAYLLLVLGRIEPVNRSEETLELVAKARSGKPVPVKFASQLGIKNPFITLKSTGTISNAVDILGNGVHRIAITDVSNPQIVVGVLSQRRIIRFLWENGRLFKSLEPLFQSSLQELGIGSKKVISIQGDKLVIDALQQMHDDGVSSLAVTDSANNLLGNISIVDARLVTKSSQKALLRSTCKQFLSIILNKRGLEDGKDSFPVFHVTAQTSLALTVAKLVATKAHRLWIVQSNNSSDSFLSASTSSSVIPSPNYNHTTAGQLVGVVSLTDILYTLAKHAGKSDMDPHSARRNRRRSSSSSVRSQSSYDKFRRSVSTDRSVR